MNETDELKVLVVDDDPDLLRIALRQLSDAHYHVSAAANGTECLEAIHLDKPDLLLLDVMLPDINGLKLCKIIKNDPGLSSIHVLLLSGMKTQSENVSEGLETGADGYLIKPLKSRELLARVEAASRIIKAEKEVIKLKESLEQRVAERTKELETTVGELAFKNKELEQFTFIASHDLQEPLLTITNFTKLIQEEYGGKLDADGNNYIAYISGSAIRMKTLLKGLLFYSLLGKDSVKSDVDCNKVVAEVLSDLSVSINASYASVTVQELPVLKGYETELKLLFRNLISNAIKFQLKGTRPEIKILAELLEKEWKFTIEDNGIGIDLQDREKVFIIFKRMVKSDEFEGIGIGLAYCKKIVELHGGRIWVESKPGGGSAFMFTIIKQ